jgi:NhaP-type Na+/H+ or K+/H+ antiporter
MARAALLFNEQAEHLCEVAMVLVLGSVLAVSRLPAEALWFVPVLFLVIRPVSVAPALWKAGFPSRAVLLVSWLGIRGIGSLYYVAYVLGRGLDPALGARLLELTLATVAASIAIHGLSSTPLMRRFGPTRSKAKSARGSPSGDAGAIR